MKQGSSSTLRVMLGVNTTFSFVCGLIAALEPAWIADLLFSSERLAFGLDGASALMATGIGLQIFAAIVALIASRPLLSRPLVKAVVAADMVWVAASIAALMLSPTMFSGSGQTLLIAVATIVGIIAVGQILGLAILYQGMSTRMVEWRGRILNVRMSRSVAAPAKVVWDVMTDHEAYAKYASNLAGVEILKGSGPGMVRRCTDVDGGQWTETAHIWVPNSRYGFEIDTQAKDYPYPLERLSAIWSVESGTNDSSLVSIEFMAVPTQSIRGKLFGLIGQYAFPKVLDDILEQWKAEMESRSRAEPGPKTVGPQQTGIASLNLS